MDNWEYQKYEDDSDTVKKGSLFNMEAGINYRIFWKIGIYGIGKYLYAQKDKIIDFNEIILLLGFTFNFGL